MELAEETHEESGDKRDSERVIGRNKVCLRAKSALVSREGERERTTQNAAVLVRSSGVHSINLLISLANRIATTPAEAYTRSKLFLSASELKGTAGRVVCRRSGSPAGRKMGGERTWVMCCVTPRSISSCSTI